MVSKRPACLRRASPCEHVCMPLGSAHVTLASRALLEGHAGVALGAWEAPSDLSNEQIASLPGAAKYFGSSDTSATKAGEKPAQVRASHLLVKHSGSRRLSSWKEVCIVIHSLSKCLYRCSRRQTLHALRMKLSQYLRNTLLKLTGTQRSSRHSHKSARTTRHTSAEATSDGSGLGRCSGLSKMRRSPLLLARSATSRLQTAVYTSSCVLDNHEWRNK